MELYYLLEKTQKGDEEAAVELLFKFRPAIKSFSKKLNYEEAETDLIIAFLETAKKINLRGFHVKSDGAIVNYFYFLLKNRSVNLFKNNVLRKIETVELKLDIIADDAAGTVDDKVFVSTLLDSLLPLQREVIKKKFLQEFTDKEIALSLGVSRQAVNRTKNRGLDNLRKII
jgi:RNA polymerase sigma factor (sigma-70 family)